MILRNQFHDILPGSSIKEVYDDSKEEYEKILSENRELTAASLGSLVQNIQASHHAVVVFNPNSAEVPRNLWMCCMEICSGRLS